MKSDSAIPEMQVAVVMPAFRAEAHVAEVLRNVPRVGRLDHCGRRRESGPHRQRSSSRRPGAIRASGCCGKR